MYLCEKGSCDEDLHHHGDDQLKDEQDNGDGTLLRDAPETVADGGLRLQREEEGSCQGLHLHDTRRVVGRGVELWGSRRGGRREEGHFFGAKVIPVELAFSALAFTLQISVHQGHQVPEHAEDEPGPCKGGREEEELVAPLHIQESRPQVAEVEGPPPAHVLDQNIAPPVFGEDSAPPSQSAGASGAHARTSIALLGA